MSKTEILLPWLTGSNRTCVESPSDNKTCVHLQIYHGASTAMRLKIGPLIGLS